MAFAENSSIALVSSSLLVTAPFLAPSGPGKLLMDKEASFQLEGYGNVYG